MDRLSGKLHRLRRLPNQLSILRLFAVPLLWVLVFLDKPFYLGIGFLLFASTDVLDGILARSLNQESHFGSKIDSLADHLLLLSALIWLWLYHPALFTNNRLLWLLAAGLGATSLLIGWLRFGQIANLHLYTSKAAGVLSTLFIAHTLISGDFSEPFFLVAAAVFILSLTELIAIQLTSTYLSEDIKSIICMGNQ